MSNAIVIDSIKKEATSILVYFTVNDASYESVYYIVDNTTSSVDQIKNSITGNVLSGFFNIPYSTINIIDNDVYTLQLTIEKFTPSFNSTFSNSISFVKLSDLTVPIIDSFASLDSFVLADLSNNGYQDNCDEISFTLKNTTHPDEEPTKEILLTLAENVDQYRLDVSFNFDKYEIFCN